jgi:hypothetical protein
MSYIEQVLRPLTYNVHDDDDTPGYKAVRPACFKVLFSIELLVLSRRYSISRRTTALYRARNELANSIYPLS